MMRLRGIVLTGLVATIVLFGTGAKEHKLVDRWKDPEFQTRQFKKLLIIAITDDVEARKVFENRFVSHLRGKGIEGVTSYSIVADLTKVDELKREEILAVLEERGVDGAISVRVVPLKKTSEEEWGTAWKEEVQGDGTLRQLIEATLPLSGEKSKKYGVEAALWGGDGRGRIWGGRTNPYTRDEMKKGAADFVQFVMYALDLVDLL
jgi:hypothetical protein